MKIEIAAPRHSQDNADHPHQQQTLTVSDGETLLAALNRHKVVISQSCGGHATCGSCRVIVQKGSSYANARTELEKDFADDRGLRDEERLSCQTTFKKNPTAEVIIQIPVQDKNS